MIMLLVGLLLVVEGGVVAWYVRRIHAKYGRLLSFLDVQDIDRRRARETKQEARDSLHEETRALLGKLVSLAEELGARLSNAETTQRTPDTPESRDAPPETTPRPDAHPVSRQRAVPERAVLLAAGLGRPRGSALPAVRGQGVTLASMPSVTAPSSKSVPRVGMLRKCSACDGGIARRESGGIGRCAACGGQGEVAFEPGPGGSPLPISS